MKKFIVFGALALAISSTSVMAHHPAADIVDADTYAMIDSLVADTPHATLEFEEMGSAMTRTAITTETLEDMDDLIQRGGLVTQIKQLDGIVNVTTSFNYDGSVTMTITQID
jgi:hypothetical protein